MVVLVSKAHACRMESRREPGNAAMKPTHSPLRRCALGCCAVALWLAASAAFAQSATPAVPTPFAPGDLSKPVFDTKTPVYDAIAGLDKSASMIVAEVEGRPITMGDVGDTIRALPANLAHLPLDTLFPSAQEQLIRQEALVVRAQQQGFDEEPVIRRKLRAAADRLLAEEYLRDRLTRQIAESQVLERYNREIAGRPGPEQVHVWVILADNESAARDLIGEIRGGADFGAVARRASKDPSAPNGGDLGFNDRDQLNPEVGAVAFALPQGQVAPFPVRSPAGWFVVKVAERRAGPTPSFASVRDELTRTLLRERMIPAATEALAGLNVRRYGMDGVEREADKADRK
jgi:peptidyl-prolyl cis-trans isomerase C